MCGVLGPKINDYFNWLGYKLARENKCVNRTRLKKKIRLRKDK